MAAQLNSDKVMSLTDVLALESMIGTITSGYSDPSTLKLGDDIPVELVVAWKQHHDAFRKLKAELDKVKL
ncbi:hypothetical protein VPHK469_0136 [Vibrio phage K469]